MRSSGRVVLCLDFIIEFGFILLDYVIIDFKEFFFKEKVDDNFSFMKVILLEYGLKENYIDWWGLV